MRSQMALFVDAGYLIAAAATKLTGSSLRSSVTVDYEKFVAGLVTYAVELTELPLLRVYWYDAARNGVADRDQERIAALARVKLRLGRVGVEGEQKGVDLRIGLDMVGHARDHVVDEILLISGDDDLTEAVEDAQALGVRVRVVAVPNQHGNYTAVSRNLIRAADDIELLPAELLDASFARSTTATAGVARVLEASTKPTPEEIRKLATQRVATLAYSSGQTQAQTYIAPNFEHDPAEVASNVEKVAKRAFEVWSRSATPEMRAALIAGKPAIPRDLDRALLVDLATRLNDSNLNDDIRRQLRHALWNEVES